MIVANTRLGVATVGMTDLIPAMCAGIDEGLETSVSLSGQDHAVLGHKSRDEIARLRNKRFVTKHQPASRKNSLDFKLVNVLIPEDLPRLACGRIVNEF
jgi:predicted ABC-type transport system involved in lysophospholipase L1 biosynthesis ATPase subunit